MKFVISPVDSLDPSCCWLHTFQDILSYHSNAVSEVLVDVAAASHARRSIEREIDQLGHFNGSSRVISCPIFENKVSTRR